MRENLNELAAFAAVAREQSFTRAAARLGMAQSSLSQIVSNLEQRLKVKLLNRTTRSVTATEAGAQLAAALAPALAEIEAGLAALRGQRGRPAGTIRITADEYAVQSVLWPAVKKFLPDYPEIKIELITDYGLVDIAREGFDAGVRRGGLVAKNMIAAPISAPHKMIVAGAPAYFARRKPPQAPADLTRHACLNLRLPTYGGLYSWTLADKQQTVKIKSEGPLVFSSIYALLEAALAGFGLAYLPEKMALPYLKDSRLLPALERYSVTLPGYYLYYTHRLQSSAAFALLAQALRYRGDSA